MKEQKKKAKNLWELYPEAPSLTNLKKSWAHVPKNPVLSLEDFGAPHIKSFDWMVDYGLQKVVKNLHPISFELPNKDRITLRILDARLTSPTVPTGTFASKEPRVFPTECRQRYTTYKGNFYATLGWSCNGIQQPSIEKPLGAIPIMLRSKLCHLHNLKPPELVARGEHETEFGGYFIAKGHEKLIRMLMSIRANYPIFMHRKAWETRGKLFTEMGVQMRCVTEDRTSMNNVLHYLSNGSVKLMFNFGRELFYIPIMMIMKALIDTTDEFVYKNCVSGCENDFLMTASIAMMLRQLHRDEGLHTHAQVKAFVGEKFRAKAHKVIGEWTTDSEVCDYVLKQICIHCDSNLEKFHVLVFCLQKLFCGVQGQCSTENVDHVYLQEVILGGHLYTQLISQKLLNWLQTLQYAVLRKARQTNTESFRSDEMNHVVSTSFTFDRNFEAFIATGNVPVSTGQGLAQTTGLTIIVENLNRLRYLAHFRSVHRGAFFQEMRTTDARQLQPDAWGFVCPVHTPDGTPCGLLNHLSAFCTVVTEVEDASTVPGMLTELGMIPIGDKCPYKVKDCYKVLLDGKVLGFILQDEAKKISDQLRILKVEAAKVPKYMEIVLIEKREKGQFPGLFLFTTIARMMRPVINLQLNKIEYIGTFEQLYLDICIVPEEAYPGITTHREVNERNFMSHLASLIPMPDCNQSPRNMYQCQMGKQTMGTPYMTYHRFTENKLYRLYFPGTPLFRTLHYDYLKLDDYPMGTNAIVAVISYTGYDMEDAMIISKPAFERGFGHGCIYKSEHVDLKIVLNNSSTNSTFMRDPDNLNLVEKLGPDGLPHVGIPLDKGDPYYCFFNAEEGKYVTKNFQGAERVYVESVKLKGNDLGTLEKSSVVITIRVPKNPRMGDKFASRAGQKGICSFLWPAEDLPFTESGLIPDIVFNPHGFPSRMTIAMMVEILAGKSGALHGLVHDASPFKFSEDDTTSEYFGKLLEKGGYNYYGTERMYSGSDGRELTADIFFGIVHYQRLRHMVSEKWQVRSTGPLDAVTHQPNKGRRRGGGVRFGEMEKDCLLSHGASFLLQDRLFYGSDRTTTYACVDCGSILSPIIKIPPTKEMGLVERPRVKCSICNSEDNVDIVEIPYVFKYLVEQLASMNIKIKLNMTHV